MFMEKAAGSVSMSSLRINRQLYRAMLLEKECCRCRSTNPTPDCSNCKIGINQVHQIKMIDEVLDILKARDPALYFLSDLKELQEMIEKVSGGESIDE